MSQNLIEDIKRAEEKSAGLINEALTYAENELSALKENFSQSIKNLEIDFNTKKKEILTKAKNDAASTYRQDNWLEKETSLLKERTGKNKDDIKGYIINKITG